VSFDDGSSAFVKAATTEWTGEWLRSERRLYAELGPRPFLPGFVGWDDDQGGGRPLMILEDLSAGFWPPPWSDDRVDRVLAMLSEVRLRPRRPTSPTSSRSGSGSPDGALWRRILSRSSPSDCARASGWMGRSPVLLDAERSADLSGDDLVHLDVRSDNICFVRERTILVDWNLACRGNGVLDVAGWLPSLEREDGPRPEDLLPDHAPLAALLAGFFASRAGLPPLEGRAGRPGCAARSASLRSLVGGSGPRASTTCR
jgi:hypothetical protein